MLRPHRRGNAMRAPIVTPLLGLGLVAVLGLTPAAPVMARLWKPTPEQIAADYVSIMHVKGTEGRVAINWLASAVIPSPALKQILEKYIVLSIIRTRPTAAGGATWDDVQGVQVTDGNGQPLKEVPVDARPPTLVGVIATSEAAIRQSTQGQGKIYWGVWEAGSIGACQKGKLVVNYEGEAYTFDLPLPGCPKS
jgi:hypothetical protein